MDGSEITVVVLGGKSVGKTTFIDHCFTDVSGPARLNLRAAVFLCGRKVHVQFVDSPDRMQLVPAIMVFLLFDITNEHSFKQLHALLELAQRVSPTALRAVIGTKADLTDHRQVTSQAAEEFCKMHSNGSSPTPYYETALSPSDSIFIAFQEIMARPLINNFLIKAATEQEQLSFVHELMQWALTRNSANIMTYLRLTGYHIPKELIQQYPDIVRDYLLIEYPPRLVPRFTTIDLKELQDTANFEDSLLTEFDEEPLSVHDVRPTIEVTRSYHLHWQDISLVLFPALFVSSQALDRDHLVHVTLSHNKLNSIPSILFQLPRLESLDVSCNELSSLPGIEVWSTSSKLQVLIASHNQITGENYSPLLYRKRGGATNIPFQELWYLDLSSNCLVGFPHHVLNFSLKYLNLSHNQQITRLPQDLCRMTQMQTLLLDGLSLTDPPAYIAALGTKAVLSYLRLKKSSSCVCNGLRVVVVGPQRGGKSSLVTKLKTDTSSSPVINHTKGLEVTEWKYRGGDIFSFRNKWFTFDLWDFSGDPECNFIYSCFNCHTSIHLVVCDVTKSMEGLVRTLSDIQAVSTSRVPVIVVFTHIDQLRSREQKEEVRRQKTHWLEYHNKKGETGSGAFSLMASLTDSVRSLQGRDVLTSYEVPQQAFEMQAVTEEEIPLMPLIIKVHFISTVTGEGIPNLRKTLYKLVSGSLSNLAPCTSYLNLIGLEIPTVYSHLEQQIRELRSRFQGTTCEGGQRVFYTLQEFRKEVHLSESISDHDLEIALRFLHELGFVYVHKCNHSNMLLVGVVPQLIGHLLQRITRAGSTAKEANIHSCYLADAHLCMLWGLQPVVSLEESDNDSASSLHLLDYLRHLNICCPLFPGTSFFPFMLPPSLPRGMEPDASTLVPRRTYIISYMPTMFASKLATRLVSSLIKESNPSSPNLSAPAATVPLKMPSGLQLYLWQSNIFLEDPADSAKLWVHVRESLRIEHDSPPYCGRIDVHVTGSLDKEAVWLRMVTMEIEYMLKEVYPELLTSPQFSEVFIPLGPEWTNHEVDGDFELSNSPSIGDVTSPVATNESPSPSQQSVNSSWEILSKHSTTSTRLSLVQDASSPQYYLVPLWECLQEAFKTPVIRVNARKLALRQAIPDLLFGDLPSEMLFRTATSGQDQFMMSLERHFNESHLPEEDTGLYIRHYYTLDDEDTCLSKPPGAPKAFYLKSWLERVRKDFLKLCQLHCPHLVSPVGVTFCPPCLTLESAPHGSLRTLLVRKKCFIGRDIIHNIALQLLSALEFCHKQNISYHSITSENVLIWSLDPVAIKLSDAGITHSPATCQLCVFLKTLEPADRLPTSQRVDFLLLGLLVFEMATGKQPFEDIYSLGTVVMAMLHNKVQLSVEAEHFLQHDESSEDVIASGCQRLCLQSSMEQCIYPSPVNSHELLARFSLCAGDNLWSPMRLLVNVECMLCSENADLVYWASGSRGLVTGTIDPKSGELLCNILQEAPTPESGLFADRRCKPVPIAVGRATDLALVLHTNQLWVGTENGQMGSVYVFNLPDMRRHHHIHLQDAVLSVCAVNNLADKFGGEEMKYRVLVGLANGTVILFLGFLGGKVLENPLQGPKLVASTHQRKPCLSLTLTVDGHIWCSCGDTIQVFHIESLKVVRRLTTASQGERHTPSKGDVVTLMAVNSRGVWTVSRRSSWLKLWDPINGQFKASYCINNALHSDHEYITSLAVQGGVVWCGTKSGHLLILDAGKMEEGVESLRGLQYCGEGKVKQIIPLKSQTTISHRLQVMCSLEFPDEVSGLLLLWEYLPSNN